jgi:hypothetical protein
MIYFADLKSNLNLDTDKAKCTFEKCANIVEELYEKYPDYDVRWCLLGLRYFDKSIIDHKILYKYNKIQNKIYGVNDYFASLKIPLQFNDEDEYKTFINIIAEEMFKNNGSENII